MSQNCPLSTPALNIPLANKVGIQFNSIIHDSIPWSESQIPLHPFVLSRPLLIFPLKIPFLPFPQASQLGSIRSVCVCVCVYICQKRGGSSSSYLRMETDFWTVSTGRPAARPGTTWARTPFPTRPPRTRSPGSAGPDSWSSCPAGTWRALWGWLSSPPTLQTLWKDGKKEKG